MTEHDDRPPLDESVRAEPLLREPLLREPLLREPLLREPPRRGFARRHWKGLLFTVIVLGPAAVFAAWTTATLAYTYSSGQRAGYNQKISRKGWLCKTWEGDLASSAAPGLAPEIFHYSVRSDSIARVLETLSGERVTITYEQHTGVPTSCFGETEYYVTGVQKVGP